MSSRFAIVTACPKKWADLQGSGRERYCDVCRKSVHAKEQYTGEEWEQLWQTSSGHLCGLVSGESPAEPRSRRAVLVGALLTAVAPLMAQTGRVRIRVTDQTGAVIPGADVSMLGAGDKPKRTRESDESGEVEFEGLPFGDVRFSIHRPGFKIRTLTATVRNRDQMVIETVLEVGTMGEIVDVRSQKD